MSMVNQDVSESGFRRIAIVVGVMLATLLQTLDSTITNVALPTIQGNLGASLDEGTWVITAYTIAAIIIIPITPWLQRTFGRKQYYVASIIGFTLASAFCGASDSLWTLVFWRAIQGIFGGGLLATGQSILRETFPPNQIGLSQGIFVIGAIMGPALGPPIGGILVDNAAWNWCFDINIVPGIIAALILLVFLRDPDKPVRTRVDGLGLALLAICLGTLQYTLTEGERHYWFEDSGITFMACIFVVSLAAFIWQELHGTNEPAVRLRILKNPSVAAGSILGIALGFAALGSTYTLPQVTQGALGFTPTESGALFIMRAIPILLITFPVVRLIGMVDARILVGSGFAIMGLANWLQGNVTTGQASFWSFAFPLILSGAGSSILYVPLTTAVLGATTREEGPAAGAFMSLSTQLGGSVAVALLDVFINQRETLHSTILGGNISLHRLSDLASLGHTQIAVIAHKVYQQSTIISYADATYAVAYLAFFSIPLIVLLRKAKVVVKEPTEEVEIELGV
jgi:DHA2 family multidrug resistance protein